MSNFLHSIGGALIAVWIGFVSVLHPLPPAQTTPAAHATSSYTQNAATSSAAISKTAIPKKQTTVEAKNAPTKPTTVAPVEASNNSEITPQQTPAPQALPITSAGSACPSIEGEYFTSVYLGYIAKNQLDSVSQLVNDTISKATQDTKNGAFSTAYFEYANADVSISTEMDSITETLSEMSTNTNYESGTNLKGVQGYLSSAASAESAMYKSMRAAYAVISSALPGDNVANDKFLGYINDAKDEEKQEATAYVNAENTLASLSQNDTSVKSQNGCDSSALQIYSDVADKVSMNPQFTCIADGYASGLDYQMCSYYRTMTPSQRSSWKIISRP